MYISRIVSCLFKVSERYCEFLAEISWLWVDLWELSSPNLKEPFHYQIYYQTVCAKPFNPNLLFSKTIYLVPYLWCSNMGLCCQCSLASVNCFTNKILRTITSSEFLAHTPPLFQETKILPIREIYQYLLAIHMFKLHSSNL